MRCSSCEELFCGIVHWTAEGEAVCDDCYREEERWKREKEFLEKREEQISKWVAEQGGVSLDRLMRLAYAKFIHFRDYGLVLHCYMERSQGRGR